MVPISMTTTIDHSSVLSSKYPILEYLSIVTSDLKKNPVHLIKIKYIMKELTYVLEYNEIEMDIEC